MVKSDEDFSAIHEIIRAYFVGLYTGDSAKLRSIFHSSAMLAAPDNHRSLSRWLMDVENRSSPESQGHAFNFRTLAIEITQRQAMVKLECPLFDHFYIDYLGLLKEEGRWLIVNKMYTDVASSSERRAS
nr:nuclear transport factor 2 family protein [Endozoicomonas sp. OPT23]